MIIKYIDRKSGEVQIEKPPGEGLLKLLYDNPFGKRTILPLVKRKMITNYYGKKMNESSSVKRIYPFVKKFGINLDESLKSLSEFTSFNDFFYRRLKPDARKIEKGLVSPGDGRLLAFEDISHVNEFFIKGRSFTLREFLADDALEEKFRNHALIILRLAPNDYHRFHFPYAGVPTATKQIKGRYYSVSPIALVKNFTKVFCENKREYCILETQGKGSVLIAPIGATLVGSIVSTYQEGVEVAKGQEMGYFEFGGSTVVLLVDNTQFKIDDDLLQNTQQRIETYVKMGESIAQEISRE